MIDNLNISWKKSSVTNTMFMDPYLLFTFNLYSNTFNKLPLKIMMSKIKWCIGLPPTTSYDILSYYLHIYPITNMQESDVWACCWKNLRGWKNWDEIFLKLLIQSTMKDFHNSCNVSYCHVSKCCFKSPLYTYQIHLYFSNRIIPWWYCFQQGLNSS